MGKRIPADDLDGLDDLDRLLIHQMDSEGPHYPAEDSGEPTAESDSPFVPRGLPEVRAIITCMVLTAVAGLMGPIPFAVVTVGTVVGISAWWWWARA